MMTKTSKTKTENLITKKNLIKSFWRSFQMEFSWNYERQMNMAYVYAMIPILKKLYPQKKRWRRFKTASCFLLILRRIS